MQIDWNQFTPFSSLLGGVLIGLAVAVLIVFNGQIAGISGILGGLLRPMQRVGMWRWAFVAGMVLAPWLYGAFATLPQSHINADWPLLLISGALVGIATRIANGCTSGHGVCGIARFSPRSMAATAAFMFSGFVITYVLKHLIGA